MPYLRAPRLMLLLSALALLALVTVACGDDSDDGGGEPALTLDFSAETVGGTFDADAQPVIVNTALATGPNRLSIGLFRADGSLILDAEGVVRLYRVGENDEGAFVAEYDLQRAAIQQSTDHVHADGTTHVHEGEFAAIFYANVDLDTAGDWGAELDLQVEGERHDGLLTSFIVLDDTPEPGIGDPMPASTNLTLRDVADISDVDSSTEPVAALNEMTVAEALDTGKPVLVAIATPAFCQTRFCGPMMEEVVVPLYEEFGDDVEFVHVEPFLLPEAREGRLDPVPMMAEWHLQSEPWIFVADRDGIVVAKFQGIAGIDEVRDVLTAAVSTNPEK